MSLKLRLAALTLNLVLLTGVCLPVVMADDPPPAYTTILDDGTAKTKRRKLNLIGFTIADDSANGRTNVTAAAGAGDITAVGNCSTGAAFNGSCGTLLTFEKATGDVTFGYVASTDDFEMTNDLNLYDVEPHLSFYDTTTGDDDFHFYVDGDQFYLTRLNSQELLRFSQDNTLYFRGTGVTYRWPIADGSNTNVLQTNGAGVLSWVAAGAGGGDSITVNSSAATDPDFLDGDIDWTLTGGNSITATVECSGCVSATDNGTDSTSADELNATGVEAELESTLDIGGEVTSTGMASTVIADSVTVTGWVMGASTATTPAADDNDTSLATTAYVQTEINAMGGRSLSASSGSMDADVELYTDTKCYRVAFPSATDDDKSIWRNSTANPFTITEIWAESDQTVTFMLQVDDGSPADVDSVDLAPAAGEAEDTSLDGDTTVDVSEELDLAITSVANSPTWFTVCWTGTWND